MNTLQRIGLITALVGVLVGIGAFLLYRSTSSDLAGRKHAQGKVVRREDVRQDGVNHNWPIVQFFTAEGARVEFLSRSAHQPGTDVDVVYEPADPTHARIYDWLGEYLFALVLAIIALFALVIGGAVTVAARG